MPSDLYPYQQEAVSALTRSHAAHQRVLLSLPTGTGKTFTAARYIKQACLDIGKVALWVAHSGELLDQAYQTFTRDIGLPEGCVARVYGKYREDDKGPDAKVWLLNNRIQGLPDGVGFIVIDEAHHADGKTYKALLSDYRCHRPEGPKVLGLTATPYRLHEGEVTPLEQFAFSKPKVPIFEETAFRRSFCELAAQGYLAPFRHIKFETRLSYKMKLQNGEFSSESLKQLDNSKRNRMIADYWRGRRKEFGKTLIFVGTKEHAKRLAKQFGDDGNYVVSGSDGREQVIADFRAGKFPVLVNVAIFKEGVDVRDIQTVMLARPTASPGLFTQMVGRGSRIAPGKRFFYLVDVHDQLGRYEDYLAGIHDLDDRVDTGLIESVERKAKAREALSDLETSSISDDAGALLDILIAPTTEILTRFGGWIAFATADGDPVPVGTLLERQEFSDLVRIAGKKQELHPAHTAKVEALRDSSTRVGKCVRALKEGLIGTLHKLDEDAAKELDSLKEAGAASFGITAADDIKALKAFTDEVQKRGQKLGVAATTLGRIENEYLQNRALFACVAWLQSESEHYARLIGKLAFEVIIKAVSLNAADKLKFSDAPRILAQIEAADPELKAHSKALLDCIGSSRTPAGFLTLCPGVTA